jgi:hypothetical protein
MVQKLLEGIVCLIELLQQRCVMNKVIRPELLAAALLRQDEEEHERNAARLQLPD